MKKLTQLVSNASMKAKTTMAVAGSMLVSATAHAMTAPTGAALNTLGGQTYDLIITDGYGSGLGYVIAGGLVVWGLMGLKTDWKDAAYKGVGGAGVAGLPAILTAFGAVVI